MRINREELLKALESVTPGLSPKEIQEQTNCIVFHEGQIITFNDEISCSRESPLGDIEGAVRAIPLLTLLSKLTEEEIQVEHSKDKSELHITVVRRQ